MIVEISKSNKSDKKLKAVINDNKTIHFGSSSHSDFTKHNDNQRKERYINRHKEREIGLKAVLILPDFMRSMCFGVRKQLKNQ